MADKRCKHCQRIFAKMEHLRRHERAHTKEKPYRCSTCGKRFGRSDVLTRHAKSHSYSGRASSSIVDATNNSNTLSHAIDDEGTAHGIHHNDRSEELALDSITPTTINSCIDVAGFSPHVQSDAQNLGSDAMGYSLTSINSDLYSDPFLHSYDLYSCSPFLTQTIPPDAGLDQLTPADSHPWWTQPDDDQVSASTVQSRLYRNQKTATSTGGLLPVTTAPVDPGQSLRTLPASSDGDKPDPRLASAWAARSRLCRRLIPDLWSDVLDDKRSNLLCQNDSDNAPVATPRRNGQLWSFDESCRSRIIEALDDEAAPLGATQAQPPQDHVGEAVIGTEQDRSRMKRQGLILPQTELFDISLDLYFFQFQPTVPIMHMPTFSARKTPTTLLLAMVCLGFSILGTTGAKRFLSAAFPKLLSRVSHELTTEVSRRRVSGGLTVTLASALLVLNLASMIERKNSMAEAEPLYVHLISLSQWHGLFSAHELSFAAQKLEGITDHTNQWKAWCKLEAVKYLIIGLLEMDYWFSNYFSTRPQIRTESLTIFSPTSSTLYTARSASRWVQLGGTAALGFHPILTPRNHSACHKTLNSDSLHCLLNVLHLHIQDAHCRMKAGKSREWRNLVLEPWTVYDKDDNDKWLIHEICSIYDETTKMQPSPGPMSRVMWHSACIALTANIQVFELALAPQGLRSSADAMSQVAVWARSDAARRACLHAGEIFHIIWHRRTSEVLNLHTALSLFRAALVFGLYVMHYNDKQMFEGQDPLELIDSFAWDEIGAAGMGGTADGNHSCRAANFIHSGGEFSISGEVYASGYATARRVLLHFADLMESLGKWKSRKLSRILHVISEDLTDCDLSEDEESDNVSVQVL